MVGRSPAPELPGLRPPNSMGVERAHMHHWKTNTMPDGEVHNMLERVSEAALIDCIRRTPLDEYVIWCGLIYTGRHASIRAQVVELIRDVWTPLQVRELLFRAARSAGEYGIAPDRVRRALQAHQKAHGASYFLVSRTADGDFVAAGEIPIPAVGLRRLKGDLVLGRAGERFSDLAPGVDVLGGGSLRLRRAS